MQEAAQRMEIQMGNKVPHDKIYICMVISLLFDGIVNEDRTFSVKMTKPIYYRNHGRGLFGMRILS